MKAPIRDSTTSLNMTNTANNKRNLTGNQINSNSTTNSLGCSNNITSSYGHGSSSNFEKTYIKVFYGDNSIILANTMCSCLHMLNFIKEQLHINKDDSIDLMDYDGILKEIPNFNNKDYGIQFVNPACNYTVIKIEYDSNINEKRFNCLLNDSKLNANMTKSLNALNIGKHSSQKDKANMLRQSRMKQQSQPDKSQHQTQQSPHTNSTNGSAVASQPQLEKQLSNLSLTGSLNSHTQSNSQTTTGRKLKAK